MLKKINNDSKVWVFQADRFLTDSDKAVIMKNLDQFIQEWSVHGTKLLADYEILHDLFIVIGAQEDQSAVSGCSKDSLTRMVKSIGESLDIDFFDRLKIAYMNEKQEIKLITMDKFKKGLQSDSIRRTTQVFNNLIETKSELEQNWQTDVRNSWHNVLLPIN